MNHVVGMNDEKTTCDMCGKVDLRGTVIVADNDHVEIGRYGTTCVAKVVGHKIERGKAQLIEDVRRQHVTDTIKAARRHIANGDWVRANRTLAADADKQMHRPDEFAAAREIRQQAREIRTAERAVGEAPVALAQ